MTASRDLDQAVSGVPRREAEPVPEMVERVARALAKVDLNAELSAESVAEYVDAFWPNFIDAASAAIEEMREPIEAQRDALSATGKMWRELDSKTVWQTYIDAALSGSRTPPDRQPEPREAP